ncbi:MAG: hypothetical protein AMXMBFR82_51380 [Candidatus Hydrogenedentota bacterium]
MRSFLAVLLTCLALPLVQASEPKTIEAATDMPALEAYEWGFAFDVMRGEAGVVLNDLVLLEDDGPGAGHSEKGTFKESIHAGVLAKKTFELDDPTAADAHVVLYMEPAGREDQPPYYLIVNGHRIEGNPISWHDPNWHWVKVPVEYLRAGANEVVVGSDAPRDKAYQLLIARDDEYEAGGGKFVYQGNTALISSGQIRGDANSAEYGFEPINVGEHSGKSTDGGKSWNQYSLGSTNDVSGEYVIRLNLTRRKPLGVLRSPAIDLWEGSTPDARSIMPQCEVTALRFEGQGSTPKGTTIRWAIRFADTPDLEDAVWGEFSNASEGDAATIQIDRVDKRYIQWEARLETTNPLATPVVTGASVTRTLQFDSPQPNTFFVTECENPRLRYSSYRFQYEDAATLQLAELRNRLKLDELLADTHGDFEKINRLRHFVSQQWYHGSPLPNYPEWNALDILDRRDACGKGGMCIQFSIVFIQSLASLGYQARHMNIFNHESVEVYIDDLGKWVHADPESVFDSYEFNTETGEPVNIHEQHEFFLAKYGLSASNPIDWMSPEPWCNHPDSGLPENKPPLEISTFTPWLNSPDPGKRPPQHNLTGFFRMMPRNNYFSQPTPRPLSQGSTWWPWNGYLNWYDEATPRKLQYALHSDRIADFYPTLNQVAFTATHGEREGDVRVQMHSITPNFESYEINVDDTGWRDADAEFVWQLNRSAVNTLEMRTRNVLGVTGIPSRMEVLYHYREPYRPREARVRE